MQNVEIVRRSSIQLHHKNHTPSYLGGTSNSSKIEVLEDASKWQDLKYIKLEWRSTQKSISFKKPKRYTPEQKVFMEIGKKHGASKSSSETVTKKYGSYCKLGGTQKHEVRKTKVFEL